MYGVITAPSFPMMDDAGVSYNTSATLTAINPGGVTNPGFIQPFMVKAGTCIEMHAWGTISTSGTTPTFIWAFALGQAIPPTAAGAVTLAATSAFTLTNQAAVAWPWRASYYGRFTQTGSSGSINGYGSVEISTSLTAFTPRNIPETTAAGIVTVNTNVAMACLFNGTWGTSAGTNIAFCHGLVTEIHG
jgi:hypothetical protein